MARAAQGFTIHIDPRTGNRIVRFRHQGRRRNLSTGTSDPSEASERAARIYADVVSGRRRDVRREATGAAVELRVLFAEWLATLTIDQRTIDTYELYAFTHWDAAWRRLEEIDETGISIYSTSRLKKVTRSTVKKELSALRGFLRWAKLHGHLESMPLVQAPTRAQEGTRHELGRRQIVPLTEKEVRKLLEQLPERTSRGNPARAFFTALYETGLRRGTLTRLEAPGDYHVGRKTLRVRASADKKRFERELPLTAAARAALDSVCPDQGRIFAEVDYREVLRRAARDAGIEEHRFERLSFHDFRHSRITSMLERTSNVAGVMYLVGHKDPQTTRAYMHTSQRAAEDALSEAFGTPMGHRKRSKGRTSEETTKRKSKKRPRKQR